jgi:iron complex outermembrane receptor protein
MEWLSCLLIRIRITLMALIGLAIATSQAKAAAPDLTEFSIEDLMQVKVVSAAKTEQALQDTAAAVFVITADDIRRSGVTQVMDALRLAPGVEVARIDSSRWAISIRGFNGRFANKLLVLIDGRTIYNAQFSGVYWELQDLFLPDIERIEVIRGPGGSLWGANAVNGVINIITKNAKDTQGGLVTLTAGDEERTIAGVRYGGKLGDSAQYRVFGQFSEREGLVTPDGRDADDDWRIGRGGFRLDWTASAQDTVAVQGDLYDGNFDQNLTKPSLFRRMPSSNYLRSKLRAAACGALGASVFRDLADGVCKRITSTRTGYDPFYIADSEYLRSGFSAQFRVDRSPGDRLGFRVSP